MNSFPILPREPADPPPRVRLGLWQKVVFVVKTFTGFVLYGVLALLVVCRCLLVAAVTRNRARQKERCQRAIHWGVCRWAAFMERTIVFHVEFPEIETLRAMRGTIFAPNHISLIDATHFLARMPRLTCLMKSSILSNPFMGISSALSGYLPNDRGTEFVRQGRDALLAGENLLIFPEGTRTLEPPVNPFKKGFALIATMADAPVQTVFIEMPVLYLGKRWRLLESAHMPIPITIRLGRSFPPQAGRSAKALGAELEEYFRTALEGTPDGGVRVRVSPVVPTAS